jgi:hypothetical protein
MPISNQTTDVCAAPTRSRYEFWANIDCDATHHTYINPSPKTSPLSVHCIRDTFLSSFLRDKKSEIIFLKYNQTQV